MSKNKTITVGIAGNPNCGKSTIFSALTGTKQKSGNYPGVTVEKKEGFREYKGYNFKIIDLPGTYSLTAYSLDEIIARDFVINEKPDVIIDVFDATNLERNLYLLLQFQELGIPIVGALNVIDQATKRGINIDDELLGSILKVPMIKTVGTRGKGVNDLLDSVIEVYQDKTEPADRYKPYYGSELETEIGKIKNFIREDPEFAKKIRPRWLAIKLLEKDEDALKKLNEHENTEIIKTQVNDSIKWLEKHFGEDIELILSEQRYGYIRGAVKEAVKNDIKKPKQTRTQKIDSVLLNRVLGLPVFLFIIWGVFQLTFTLSEYPVAWLEIVFEWLGKAASAGMPEGLLKSFVVDGLIGGIGAVMVFLPLLMILFFFISLLEDSGYMSRSAFIMDKFLHIFGLHGQSFIPLFIGFGCTVPAIMGTRTLKNQKDRIVTILVLSLISCGARLPVYALLIGAFFPDEISGNILFSIYLIGVFLALLMAALFRKTIFKGEKSPFVMELPPYRMPTANGLVFHVWDKSWHYIRKAGKIIFAASVVIWFATTFPQTDKGDEYYQSIRDDIKQEIADEVGAKDPDKIINIDKLTSARIEEIRSGDQLENSAAGMFGKFIEPALRPLGFDWKIGVALTTGFAGKEIVVSTMGILYKVGGEETEESVTLRTALRKDDNFNPLVAYVLMLFVLIYVPCMATITAIKQELGHWKWTVFVFVYQVGLAWLVSFAVYQIGSRLIGY